MVHGHMHCIKKQTTTIRANLFLRQERDNKKTAISCSNAGNPVHINEIMLLNDVSEKKTLGVIFANLSSKGILAIHILAEIKLQDEMILSWDINFMKEFKTFLDLFLP